ncbi:MAG TPA: molybdenum cofactor guanylyltransferase [Solirubrobacterales bacterium]
MDRRSEATAVPSPTEDHGRAEGSGAGPDAEALGVVLAGGRGSRLGGAKPTAELAGRPLISYPLAALAEAGLQAVIVVKPDTDLGGRSLSPMARQRTTALGVVELIVEPEEPVHPLAGIVAALRQTGLPLVVVGCDFPFVPAALLRVLADAAEPLVVPAPGGAPQPLVARWTPPLLPALEGALVREEPLRRTVAALAPRLLDDAELAPFGDPARAFFNVNTPDDLEAAARLL